MNIERAFDLLQLHLCPKGGGRVSVTYAREQLTRGLKLKEARDIADDAWQEIVVQDAGPTSVLLLSGDRDDLLLDTETSLVIDCGERGQMMVELMSFSYCVSEWDAVEQRYVSFVVDEDDWDNYLDDLKAAENVCDAVREQLPTNLDVIAGYMEVASGLGSEEARAWLADYYGQYESPYEAYV